jgi:hypothetical protein
LDTSKKTTIVGLVAIISVLCLTQAGCGEQRQPECAACNCNDTPCTATNEVEAQNKALVGDVEKLKKQVADGGACLAREEARKKGEEMKLKTEAETCDSRLIDSTWMDEGDNVCPFDPQKISPFRQLSAEEKLAANYKHSLEYRHSEFYLENALECPDERTWSKYTRAQVQERYNCLQSQYYKAHKDVVLYTKPLGMHFVAPCGAVAQLTF